MITNYWRYYSHALNRETEIKCYGHAGRPVLFIPCQGGRFFDFENYHMTDVWAKWIDAGECMVFAIDTIDDETWTNGTSDPYNRIRRHEQWIQYITDEVVPFIRGEANFANNWSGEPGIMVFGASLGATHAANLYLRRPDLFDRLLALSGIYTASYGFGDYMDEVVYQNSPVDYMANLPADHPYIGEWANKKAIIVCGQGAWEIPDSTLRLRDICAEKGVNVQVELWGYDVKHDWDWWYKQVDYYVPQLL